MTRAFPGNARAIWPTARSLSEVPKLHKLCVAYRAGRAILLMPQRLRRLRTLRRSSGSILAEGDVYQSSSTEISPTHDLNQISIRMAPLLVLTLVITLLLCLVTTVLVIRLLITILALTLLRITLLPLVCALLRMTLLPPLAPLLLPIVLLRIALVSPTVPPPRRLAIALATAPVAVAPVARARPPRRPIAPVIATPVIVAARRPVAPVIATPVIVAAIIVAPIVVAPIVISAWWGRRRVARSYGWSRMLRDRHAQLAPINLLAITALRLGETWRVRNRPNAGVAVWWGSNGCETCCEACCETCCETCWGV